MGSRTRWIGLGAAIVALAGGAALRLIAGRAPAEAQAERTRGDRLESSAPDDAAAQGRLAVTLAREARRTHRPELWDQAGAAVHRALARDPGQLDALRVRLLVLENGHHFLDVAQAAAALEVRFPRDPFFPQLRGDAELELGRYDDAAGSYQRMIDLRPDATAYGRVGYLRMLEGDLDGAVEILQLAARSAPATEPEQVAWALCDLGDAYLAKGDPERALPYFEVALVNSPGDARALVGRGHVLRARGALDRAIEAYHAAVRADPRPAHHALLGDALAAAGRTGEAHAERALALDGARDDPRLLAQLLCEDGVDLPRAETLARAEHARRQDIFTEDVLAYALFLGGKRTEAAGAMARALRLGTRDARLSFHAGVIAAASGDRDAARRHLTAALSRFPPLPPAQRAEVRRLLDGELKPERTPAVAGSGTRTRR